MTEIEKRGGTLGVETRAADGKRTLVGYAIVYDSPTLIGDPDWGFTEVFDPGSMVDAIGGDIRALVDHDSGRVIGRTKSGTLRLTNDDKGVRAEIDVPDTTDGNDLWALVDRGDISGMSFAFRATKQEWDDTTSPPTRTVLQAELYEVSAVAFPAYDDTTLAKRSLEVARAEAESVKKEAEQREADAAAARRRVAERKARQEQQIRGIRQDAT